LTETIEPSLERVAEIEVELLTEAIYRRYGHDFRNYARASLSRRFSLLAQEAGVSHVAELIPLLLRDPKCWEKMFPRIPVTVSSFFRDPAFFRVLREEVFPVLGTYPVIRIWHAGCGGGEEVYSLAILLHEAGLLGRARIYATDFNDAVLERAEAGIYEASSVEEAARRYKMIEGASGLESYFTTGSGFAKVRRELTQPITFANHNLVTDGSFGTMHMVLCRNVFIYFNRTLQERVLRLFAETLAPLGWLGIGSRESVKFSDSGRFFDPLESCKFILRKKGGSHVRN